MEKYFLFPGTAKGILPSPKYQDQLLGPKQLAFKRYRVLVPWKSARPKHSSFKSILV
jgi:hypothetical protein